MVESNHKLGVRLVFWHRQLSRVDTSRGPERKLVEQLKRQRGWVSALRNRAQRFLRGAIDGKKKHYT